MITTPVHINDYLTQPYFNHFTHHLFFFFNNLGCSDQHTRPLTNPMGSIHRTLKNFPTRIRVNSWLFTT
jgi:hypothetical protein